MMRKWTFGRARRDERGSVLLLAAAAIVVLLGLAALVVDLGRIYVGRQRAQNVCDAAALAGAWGLATHYGNLSLAESTATQLATQSAASNNAVMPAWQVLAYGTSNPGVAITFPSGAVTDDAGRTVTLSEGDAIKTQGSVNVSYFFARIFSLTAKTVSASCTVVVRPTDQFCSDLYAPLAVSNLTIFGDGTPQHPPITFGTQVTLKTEAWQDNFIGPGNFGAVVLPGDGPGAASYRARLSGDAGTTCLSATPSLTVETKTGNMVGPTNQGLQSRLGKETDPRFTNDATAWQNWVAAYDPNTMSFPRTWRLMIVMVMMDPSAPQGGRTTVDVTGMAGFFIESSAGDGTVTGRFVQGIVSGSNVRWAFPAGDSPSSTQLIYSIRVIS